MWILNVDVEYGCWIFEVHANDNNGLLEGKFEGSFEDGVSPWVWTGSCKIFEHFLRNGCKPVKYGQCWVFAAVATSSRIHWTPLILVIYLISLIFFFFLRFDSLPRFGYSFPSGDQLRVGPRNQPHAVHRQVFRRLWRRDQGRAGRWWPRRHLELPLVDWGLHGPHGSSARLRRMAMHRCNTETTIRQQHG